MYNVKEDVSLYKCYRCGGNDEMRWIRDSINKEKYYPFCKKCFDELSNSVTEYHVKKDTELIIRGYMKSV